MNLGNKINKIRKENNLSQEEFAEALNVSRQTVSNWENYKSYPDIATLIFISNKFNISLDTLLKGDEKMVKELDKKINSFSKLKIFIIIIIILLGFIIYNYAKNYYNNHYTPITNSDNLSIFMNIAPDKKDWSFQISEPTLAQADFNSTTYYRDGKKINLIFLTCYTTPRNSLRKGEGGQKLSDLDHQNISLNEKIEVYYTTQNISKHTLKDLNNEELNNLISNSTLIFDNTLTTTNLNCTLNNETYTYNFNYFTLTGQIVDGSGDLTIPKSLNLFEQYNFIGLYKDTRDVIESLQNYFNTNNGSCTINN